MKKHQYRLFAGAGFLTGIFRLKTAGASICLFFGLVSLSAHALFVTEDFYYPAKEHATALAGESGGSGWNGAWQGNSFILFSSTMSLAYSNYQVEQTANSGSLYSTTANYRSIYRNLASPASGEVWFSYIFRQGGSTGAGGLLFNDTAGGSPTAWNVMLAPGGDLNATVNGVTSTVLSGLANAVDYLVLGRMVTGVDGVFELWVSPSLTGVSKRADFTDVPDFSVTGAVNPNSISSLGIAAYYSGGTGTRVFRFDALRLSDGGGNPDMAFAEVSGTPKPAKSLRLIVISSVQ